MKKLASVLSILFFCFSAFGIDVLEYVPPNNSVKSYTATNYIISSQFGDYFRTVDKKITHKFEAEREMEISEFSHQDALLTRTINMYDSYGKLELQYATDASHNILWRKIYTYDNRGLCVDISEENGDKDLISRRIFIYNNDNLLIDETVYDGSGVLTWKTNYSYRNKRLARKRDYDATGALYEAKTYEYNDDDSIASIDIFDSANTEPVKRELFRYIDGRLNEITTVNHENRTIARKIIRYGNDGNVQRVSDYNVANKFGTTVNELFDMREYKYEY